MTKLKYLAYLLFMLVVTGCYKDLGNYDYSEINEVNISGFPENKIYAFRNSDSLKVYPQIKGTLDGDDLGRYQYKWVAVVKEGTADNKTEFTIGDQLNLEYFIQLPDAEYSVYLYVTDGVTGVTWRRAFDLKVTTSLNEGWLVLSEVDGLSRLDVISLSGKDEVLVRDVWNGSPFSLRKGPRQLAFTPDLYGSHGIYFISEDGTTRLDGENFGYEEMNEFVYELGKYQKDFKPLALRVSYMDAWNICITKDGVYTKNGMAYGAVYGLPINKIEGEAAPFGVAPAIGMPMNPYAFTAAMVLYDTTNRRFVQILSNLKGMKLPSAKEEYFPFKTGRKFVYMTNTLQDQGITFTILKDETEKHWLYGMKVQGYSKVEQLKDYYYPMDAPEIENADCFAVHPILYYLFYAVGDRIHQFDLITKKHRVLPLEFPDGIRNQLAGENISMLKFNIFSLGSYGKPAGSEEMQYRLMVGSEGTGGEKLNGKVRMFDIPTSTDKSAVLYKEYNGFGKVVDVTYRERR